MPAMKTLVMVPTLSLANSRWFFRSLQALPQLHHWRGCIFRPPWRAGGTDLLILKLTIVPLALLLFGIVERLHGPRVAGWLAGFPIVGGPLLVFITLDHGTAFGSAAALGAYFGLVPWLAFTMTYAFCARSMGWLWCTIVGFTVWTAVAVIAVMMQGASRWLEILPFRAFLAALFAYPRGDAIGRRARACLVGPAGAHGGGRRPDRRDHPFRRQPWARRWSGIFTTFPVMGSIICISSHLQYGRHAVQEAVAGMSMGLASVGSFCFAVYLLLGMTGMWTAFALALALSIKRPCPDLAVVQAQGVKNGSADFLGRAAHRFQRRVDHAIVMLERDEPGAALQHPHAALEQGMGESHIQRLVGFAAGRDSCAPAPPGRSRHGTSAQSR